MSYAAATHATPTGAALPINCTNVPCSKAQLTTTLDLVPLRLDFGEGRIQLVGNPDNVPNPHRTPLGTAQTNLKIGAITEV